MQIAGQSVLVTGAAGFFGRHIARAVQEKKPQQLWLPSHGECDLRDGEAVEALYRRTRPDVVIHAAGVVGGIGANRAHPGQFFYDNAMMGLNVIERARRARIEKLVVLGTICSYPKLAPMPMREEDLWNGYPEETNAPYGLAKKMLLVQLQAYRQEYGCPWIYLMPVNLFGPEDNFAPASSHVIPALILKCLEALEEKRDHIVVWGTGQATREFLFVEDAARAVVLATEQYEGAEPVNLVGSGEISVADLVTLVAEVVGFKGAIVWDDAMPDGQPRRSLDGTRAQQAFGFSPTTSLRDGLKRTVDWFLAHRSTVAAAG